MTTREATEHMNKESSDGLKAFWKDVREHWMAILVMIWVLSTCFYGFVTQVGWLWNHIHISVGIK